MCALIRLVKAIGERALYYGSSFTETAMLLAEDEEYNKCDFLKSFLKLEKDGLSVPEAFKKAIYTSKFNITSQEKDAVIRFCRELCVCRRESIEENTRTAVNELEAFKRNAYENKEKKSKTAGVMTVSAGIIIVLTFI